MLKFSHSTHPGRVRTKNEDSVLLDITLGLGVLCDGVGGHTAGEVASRLGCSRIADAIRAGSTLLQAVHEAHKAILSFDREKYVGMATTVVAVHFVGNTAEIVWAGDSGAFLLSSREKRCSILTQPHSLVSELVALGKLTSAEAREHELRHVVTQSLGITTRPFKPEHITIKLNEGDRVLICSDGVSDVLQAPELWNLAADHVEIEEAAETVVSTAVEQSGDDNTTALVVEYL